MRKPDQFLSIFFLDPRIFHGSEDESELENKIKLLDEIGRRVLSTDWIHQNVTSHLGALVLNLKSKDGKEWYRDFVDGYESHHYEVTSILDDISKRLIDLPGEFLVEDILNLSELEKEYLCKEFGVTGFLSLEDFTKGDFYQQDWWIQYESGYRKVDIELRIDEMKNMLLHSDNIQIFDRYWEPDNNPVDKDYDGYRDSGYKFAHRLFEVISQRKCLGALSLEIHTSEKSHFYKPERFSRRQNKVIPGKFDRHKLSDFKELRRSGGRISSYEDFYSRAKVCLRGVRAIITTWIEGQNKKRVFATEFGGIISDYGVNQHFPGKKDTPVIMPPGAKKEFQDDFKAGGNCVKSKLLN